MARRTFFNLFSGGDSVSNFASSGAIRINGANIVSDGDSISRVSDGDVVVISDGAAQTSSVTTTRANAVSRGSVATLNADGSITFTFADGRVVECGPDECVLICGGETFRGKGAVQVTCPGPLSVVGSNLRLAAPTAASVSVTGSNADVTVEAENTSVNIVGSNGTVRCRTAKNVTQRGSNSSVYRA